ncbi:hypothetical protein AB0C12_12640 [Actinoplanes sp. NPDC048967]|uniref:hypothetical protein n=1 Tax=Actinoplanes sp. NPDC048967 TaxID=3155269 RepID=UPI0033CCE573
MVMLLLTLLCLPVVIVQQNWAGLAVVVLALLVSTREVMAAIQHGRTDQRARTPPQISREDRDSDQPCSTTAEAQ